MRLCGNETRCRLKKLLREWMPEIFVFILFTCFFGLLWLQNVTTDIQPHAYYVRDAAIGKVPLPANFLYYLSVYIVSLGNVGVWQRLCFASAVVLGLSVTAKFALTRRLLAGAITKSSLCMLPQKGRLSAGLLSLLFSLALLIVSSIPMRLFRAGGYFYLGQIPPNVWHNSTTIYLMPFALLLFHRSWLQISNPSDRKGLWLILLLVALNVFAKPSFIFVFLAVYPLFMLRAALRRANLRLFFLNMVPVAVAGLLTLGMYLLIYAFSFGTTNPLHVGRSGVAIRPFMVWRSFSPDIPLSVLLSLVFPAAYVLLYPKESGEPLMRYAWSLYIASVLIFILFAETGPRLSHGNFFWQTVVCAYILFFVTCARFSQRLFASGVKQWKNRILVACLSAHVLSGMVYLPSIFVRGTFL